MSAFQHILLLLVRFYRWVISPAKLLVFGPAARCRFEPTCSGYALEAIGRHGAIYGSWLSVKRICRCHPWGDCGHDPVPPLRKPSSWRAASLTEVAMKGAPSKSLMSPRTLPPRGIYQAQ